MGIINKFIKFFTMSTANYGICAKAADCSGTDACCSDFAKSSGGAKQTGATACWPLAAKKNDAQVITGTPANSVVLSTLVDANNKGYLIADCVKPAATGSQALVASAAAVATAVYMM